MNKIPFGLFVFNPSNYSRGGYVTTPWKPIYEQTHISSESLILRDQSGKTLSFQVDCIDPADPTRNVLIFLLNEPVPPGPKDYSSSSSFISIESGKIVESQKNGLGIEIVQGRKGARAVKLFNTKLSAYINLTPTVTAEDKDDERNWYAGASTSVVLNDLELLDTFRSNYVGWIGHDPEKRCMQIDQIQLLRPPWETTLYQSVSLFDQPYELIAHSTGPLRTSITIASKPFDYSYSDYITRKEHHLKCRLYRIIGLYSNAGYLMEELFVKGVPDEHTNTEIVNLYFIAHYFAYMDIGYERKIYSFFNIPDWFAVGYPNFSPYQGYGFATDVHAGPVVNPHPDFPICSAAYKTFSWKLFPGRHINCIHLFMSDQSIGFDSRIGHCWYELIYKILKAELKIFKEVN